MESAKKSISITFATQYLELSIQFVAVLILSRLLTPADTGVFSVAAFFMVLLHMFRDFGVVNYIIQEPDLNTEKIQSAFGVAILLALAVAGVMMLSAGAVARFYDQPQLIGIMHVMALSFAISPFGSLLFGLYRREMMFTSLFFIKIASALCHVAVATTLAYRGFGAISLAWANFAGILSFGLAANLYRPAGLPWLPRFSNFGKILSFGSMSSMGNAANAIGTNSPDLIIAKMIDMTSVGYFSRGNGLVQLFAKLIASALTPFTLPYFSQIKRGGTDLKQPYLLAINYLTVLSWPFFAVMALLAHPIVRVLYGSQWDASVPVVELLCIAGAIASMSIFASHVMIANGQVKQASLAQVLAQPIKVVAVLLAASGGLRAVALALILGELIGMIITNRYLYQTIGITTTELLATCRHSALVTIASMVGPAMVMLLWPAAGAISWLALFAGAAAALTGWLVGVVLTRHPAYAQLQDLLPKHLKNLCKILLYQSGCMGLVHRWRNRHALTVVMFHRVMPTMSATADPEWSMQTGTFRQCLAFFKKHYHVITLDQLTQALGNGQKLPTRSLLITFDDGWADTAEYAQPILETYQLSGTVFIAGSVINRLAPFWQEAVYSVLSSGGIDTLNQALADNGLNGLVPAGFDVQKTDEAAIRAVIRQLEQGDPEHLQRLAAQLHAQSGEPAAMLSARQLIELAATQQIGSHGYTHQPLTHVADPGREVSMAQQKLCSCLNDKPIHAMSFPHGSYDEHVIAACRAADYQLLFSSDPILNNTRQPKLHQLVFGRIAISEREITDTLSRFHPFMLAFWLFFRPIDIRRYPGPEHER